MAAKKNKIFDHLLFPVPTFIDAQHDWDKQLPANRRRFPAMSPPIPNNHGLQIATWRDGITTVVPIGLLPKQIEKYYEAAFLICRRKRSIARI